MDHSASDLPLPFVSNSRDHDDMREREKRPVLIFAAALLLPPTVSREILVQDVVLLLLNPVALNPGDSARLLTVWSLVSLNTSLR